MSLKQPLLKRPKIKSLPQYDLNFTNSHNALIHSSVLLICSTNAIGLRPDGAIALRHLTMMEWWMRGLERKSKWRELSFVWQAWSNEQCKAWAAVIIEHADDKSINRRMQQEGQRLFPLIWCKGIVGLLHCNERLRGWPVTTFEI